MSRCFLPKLLMRMRALRVVWGAMWVERVGRQRRRAQVEDRVRDRPPACPRMAVGERIRMGRRPLRPEIPAGRDCVGGFANRHQE